MDSSPLPAAPLAPSDDAPVALAASIAATEPATPGAPEPPAPPDLALELASLRDAVQEAQRIAHASLTSLDKIHQENQRLRQGEIAQAMLPLWRDVIRLHDDVSQLAAAARAAAPLSPEQLQSWELVSTLVTDMLYRQGVEPYHAEVGDAFDAQRHKVVQPLPTPDAALDRTLARVRRIGFMGPSGPVRLLEADVYRHQIAPAP